MKRIVIIGGGWAGCAAAVAAAKSGVQVSLLERTDMLLGLGNVGGIMRNNGRFTAAEENIAMGASELFEITDSCATHKNVSFPGHEHATFYNVIKVEPAVRELLRKMGIEVRFMARVVDAVVQVDAAKVGAVKLAGGELVEGDVFIDCTGTTGPMGNCLQHGNGCSMCVLRCPSFGPRVSITEKVFGSDYCAMRGATASAREGGESLGVAGSRASTREGGESLGVAGSRASAREGGESLGVANSLGVGNAAAAPPAAPPAAALGAFSGSCKLDKASLSEDIQKELNERGVAIVPLPEELINRKKLGQKVCQQYALDPYAENIILIDTGFAKMMTPYFPLEDLRRVDGFQQARFIDPYAAGKGNSVRYMAVARRDEFLRARGEAAGAATSRTAANSLGRTNSLGRQAAPPPAAASNSLGRQGVQVAPPAASVQAAEDAAAGRRAASSGRAGEGGVSNLFCGGEKAGLIVGHTEAITTGILAGFNGARKALSRPFLKLPETTAIGLLVAMSGREITSAEDLERRYTFAGEEVFQEMKEKGLYSTDVNAIRKRIEEAGLEDIYNQW